MSRVCCETGKYIKNPYHNIMAVLRDSANGRIAFSNLEQSLCDEVFNTVKDDLLETPDEIEGYFGYAVEGQFGVICKNLGTVRLSSPVRRVHGNYRFLNEAVVDTKLPKSAASLKQNPEWLEQAGGGWKTAEWAIGVYEELQRN